MSPRSKAKRPNPFQWIAYACGRKLPDSMQDWVRNDLIGDWAVPRHMIRSMVPFLPIFAAFFLFPGPVWLRGSMVLLGVFWRCSSPRPTWSRTVVAGSRGTA